MKRTLEEKKNIIKRAKAIQHTFGNRSMFSAIKYIIKFG